MYLSKIKEARSTCKRATASSFVKVAGTRTTRLGRTRENAAGYPSVSEDLGGKVTCLEQQNKAAQDNRIGHNKYTC